MCEGKMEILKGESLCYWVHCYCTLPKHGFCSHNLLTFIEIFSSEGHWNPLVSVIDQTLIANTDTEF